MSQRVAVHLSAAIGAMPEFTLLSKGDETPVFAWRLADDFKGGWTLPQLSDALRYHGWQVPAYPMPASIEDVEVMRIVVRNGLSMDLADKLLSPLLLERLHLTEKHVRPESHRRHRSQV